MPFNNVIPAGGDKSNNEPWVARILDSIADVWHVILPIADDLTSAWLLASTASDATAAAAGSARPVWWACLAALATAGFERAWLLATLGMTAAVMPLLWCGWAALRLVSWCGRICCSFPAGTVCCLLLLCCCQPCIKFVDEHPRGWRFTAARLFSRLNCTGVSTARGGNRKRNTPARLPRGAPSQVVMFLDALLWAIVGSRARCSRFWVGLGWSLNAAGPRPPNAGGGIGGGGVAARGTVAFGDVIDTWVGLHPYNWLGDAIFGKLRLSSCSGCRRLRWRWWCCCCSRSCEEGCSLTRGGGGGRGDGSNGTSNENDADTSNIGSNSGSSSEQGGQQQEDTWSSSRRRRGAVLVRAVGETLVVDGLSLALSAVSRGGWSGSLTGIAGVSAVFSALQLLTELRYYVKEASDAFEPLFSLDGDGGDVEGGD